jgi:hypothetical protein
MTTTLDTLIERVGVFLMDGANRIWDAQVLAECVRLAVGAYNLALESCAGGGAVTPVTLAGLDGAEQTTLPASHAGLVVLGAAGFAALARSADRSESYQLNSEAGDLYRWGGDQLAQFLAGLGQLYPPGRVAEAARIASLHAAVCPPWAAWGDDESSGEDS